MATFVLPLERGTEFLQAEINTTNIPDNSEYIQGLTVKSHVKRCGIQPESTEGPTETFKSRTVILKL